MVDSGFLVVIVADDLTGAMDAAAPFARRGLEVRVLTSPAHLPAQLADLPQVLSINTDTRHATEAVAAAVVGALIRELAQLKPQLLFKKIDSTLRGNLVVEIVAAMRASGCREVLICPAVPAQGRTLAGGELFINAVPLRETAIGRDLRSAPSVLPLPELFRGALPDVPVTLEVAGEPPLIEDQPAQQRIRIADAANSDQLFRLAKGAAQRCRETLFVGAAGLSEALAEALFGPTLPVTAPAALPGGTLFVVGSRAPQAAAQVAALLAAQRRTRIVELTAAEPLDGRELHSFCAPGLQPASLVLRAPLSAATSNHDPDLVARALADSTVALLAQAELGLLVATGGDTVLALLEALKVGVIRVGGEVRPGIVHGLIETARGPLRLVTKAGGFGDEQLFCLIETYFK